MVRQMNADCLGTWQLQKELWIACKVGITWSSADSLWIRREAKDEPLRSLGVLVFAGCLDELNGLVTLHNETEFLLY